MTGLRRHLGGVLAVVVVAAVGVAALVAARNGAGAAHASPPRIPAQASAGTAAQPDVGAARPLKGKIVGIDPGHNGGNFTHTGEIATQVWNGRQWENCDTTGTQTDSGYTEALFNFRVAEDLRADLIRDGARVVMTRPTNDGVGPCVDRRASILNHAHADVAVDIHADGAPPSGRGFTVLEPLADGPNDKVIDASARFGADVKAAMLAGTPMPVSDFDGVNGFKWRDDLAGLNLTTVPKILIEVGNMQNETDVELLTSAKFQHQVGAALAAAIIAFLR